MGLINSVTMQYFNTVIKNLKSTLISKIDEASEVYVGSTPPSADSSYKVWVKDTEDTDIEIVPFVDDNTPSAENTYSSAKIEEIKTNIEDDVNYLMGLTNTLSTI